MAFAVLSGLTDWRRGFVLLVFEGIYSLVLILRTVSSYAFLLRPSWLCLVKFFCKMMRVSWKNWLESLCMTQRINNRISHHIQYDYHKINRTVIAWNFFFQISGSIWQLYALSRPVLQSSGYQLSERHKFKLIWSCEKRHCKFHQQSVIFHSIAESEKNVILW